MQGKIFLSCGHEDMYHPNGWTVVIKEEGCDAISGFHAQVSYNQYCSRCFADALLSYPDMLCKDQLDVDRYFSEYNNGKT